jgi:Mannose-6-phosphate isomerase
MTSERCWIVESWNDGSDTHVSVARARVEPGVTTQLHRLRGVVERYLVLSGTGLAKIGDGDPTRVGPSTVVLIPEGTKQQITNDGATDLIFYAICTPRFTVECYESLE